MSDMDKKLFLGFLKIVSEEERFKGLTSNQMDDVAAVMLVAYKQGQGSVIKVRESQ